MSTAMAPAGLPAGTAAAVTGVVALGICRFCGVDLRGLAGNESLGCLAEEISHATCENLSTVVPAWGRILLVALACEVIVMLCFAVCCCHRRCRSLAASKPSKPTKSQLILELQAGIDVQRRLGRTLAELGEEMAAEAASVDGEPIVSFNSAYPRVEALVQKEASGPDADPLTRLGIPIDEFWQLIGRHAEEDPELRKLIAAWKRARSCLLATSPLHTFVADDDYEGPLPQNLQSVEGVMSIMRWMLEDLEVLVSHVQDLQDVVGNSDTAQTYDQRVVAFSANVVVEAGVLAHFQVCPKDITEAVRQHRVALDASNEFNRVNKCICEHYKKLLTSAPRPTFDWHNFGSQLSDYSSDD